MQFTLSDSTATEALGAALAPCLVPGLVVFLSGDLGAGKTTLTRGLLRALGVTGRVKSPTYSLVEVYAVSSLNLYHFDFYRFSESSEWSDAGFRDLFGGNNVCLVEWPEKAAGQLPPPDLTVRLDHVADHRRATLDASSEAGQRCLAALSDRPLLARTLRPDYSAS
ncbi:MAG: tRNA (adenosine(37)-N6)-threonylcarbamoyltransferase complex ATPase subunit type 1 TsaE [Betaproteobacteria bacterium]|nr:tRNA (adenosine(37)-N6)-threonylcarbamoyltransferase complex ATPase subunit type 1 TsaE [Betaproteobacteria bacterium]